MWLTGSVSAVYDVCIRFDSYHLPVIRGVSVISVKYVFIVSRVLYNIIRKTVNKAVGNVSTFTYRGTTLKYIVTPKKRELLKTPTKIEEIQEKKFIDRN